MKRLVLLFSTFLLTVFIVSACGDNKKEITEQADQSEANDAENNTSEGNTYNGYPDLITYMEKELEGKANMLYENSEAQTHEMEDVTVTLDSYVLVELNDFNNTNADAFDGENDGAVIIAHYTIENELDHDTYYMPHPYMEIHGADQTYSDYYKLLPEEERLTEKLSDENDYLIKAGETISGYYGYAFGKETLDKALDLSTVTVYIGEPHSEKGNEVDSVFGKPTQFTLSVNEDGAKKTTQ
ncbi:DUF5068 domain-containing protein [Pseudogracilibacillus sp. SO30301A]|uniref:DUF5068 domain-containing protein n=1 Tax=Pseudogracilibacillus sp. SO30301A TaxID=3098291 RepID=UPI00300DE596